jgi:glycosyltransferase involved in cell wall biosynthesis
VNGLVSGLRALEDPPAIVILGGRDLKRLPAGLPHVIEPLSPPTNLGWTLVGLPLAARRGGVDVLHAPAYTAPFWSPVPVVLTIHDVSYERHPEWYPYRRDRLRRAFYRRSATSAAQVITVSEFSAGEIRAAYRLSADRITVVPHGVDAVAFENAEAVRAASTNAVPAVAMVDGAAADGSAQADVSPPYLLHVGDLHERRNLPVVVDALVAARRRGGATAGLRLVLAGVDRGQGAALIRRVPEGGGASPLIMVGSVSDAELCGLYRGAVALTYPSLYEGFGLPVLEAMAMGTPVLASRAASIPEVVGEAGLLLDPHDVGAWTEAIVRVANDGNWRRTLHAAGLARAAGFTWARTAAATLDVYRRVARR